jgi:HEAT repeat protein
MTWRRDKAPYIVTWIAVTFLLSGKADAMNDAKLVERLTETIATVRTTEFGQARTDAAERLDSLTHKIDPAEVDDKTLADLISLLDTWDDSVRSPVVMSLGNLGPRAKSAVPALKEMLTEVDCLLVNLPPALVVRDALTRIGETPPPPPTCDTKVDPIAWNQRMIEAITEVRTSESSVARAKAAIRLHYMTFWVGSKKEIDDRAIAGLVSLLDIPDDPVREVVTAALGNVGPRAKAAVPMLRQLLPKLDCHRGSALAAENVRYALKQMGVKPPRPLCEAGLQ